MDDWECWHSGILVQWCSGAVVQWCSGAVVQWCSGAVVQWSSGALAKASDFQLTEPKFKNLFNVQNGSTCRFNIEQVHSTRIGLVHSTQKMSGGCFNPESFNRKSYCLTNAPSHSMHWTMNAPCCVNTHLSSCQEHIRYNVRQTSCQHKNHAEPTRVRYLGHFRYDPVVLCHVECCIQ